jgi:cytosine/adenosine deaminase-related metal-dependent hydrolase
MYSRFKRVLACIFVAGAAAGSAAAADTARTGLVIDRVTVVDVRTGRLTPNRAIVIADGKIVWIAPAGSVKGTDPSRRIDGRGRFVVPGFNDMHAHNLNADSPATSLPLMLANGITGFRQMAGAPQLLAARASGAALMPADSPALLAMPGAILTGPAFADPAAVTAEVARQKVQGADFIKAVELPSAAFLAAADAARANGLPFAGHLPLSVNERDAMRHGMTAIEHLGPGISLLLNCSRDEAAIRSLLASVPPGGGPNFGGDPALVRRMLVNPMLATPPPAFAVMRRVLASYDAPKCQAFAQEIAMSGTWIVPTLVRLEAMELGNSPALRDNPDLRYVPAASRALWSDVGAEFDRKLASDQRQTLADLFAAQLKLTALFDAAGVKMLAGTDFGGGWIVPGSSLHREFDMLARAGLSPLRVLRMTTLDAATFLGRDATMGTVEPGRNADLVLLDGDPTKSVANLHKVAGVVRAGRYLDRAALDRLTADAAAALQQEGSR